MQSANLISPAFVTHSDVFYSNNELSYLFSRASFPDDSAFSAYVEIGSDRVPLAIAADPAGVLKVRAQFVMSSSRAFAAYPLPEGDRYAHACEPSPLQLVKLGVVSYQNAVPGPSQEESFLVLKGGLHATDFRLEGIRYLTRQKDAQLHFLSRQPVIRKVHPQEPSGLMFLANFTPLPLVLFCVREFRFGGIHEDRVVDELQLIENQMYYIPTDVKSLAIPDECFAYEVYLLDPLSGKRFSQVRMYHIDRKAYERVFIVAYENALGGYETLYFTGDDSQSEKITSSDTVDLASDPARAGRRINVEGNLEITLRTGFYSPGLEVALRELLYSPDVYLITPAGHRVPVLVSSSDLTLPGGQANPSAEITFTLDSSSPFPLHQLLHF